MGESHRSNSCWKLPRKPESRVPEAVTEFPEHFLLSHLPYPAPVPVPCIPNLCCSLSRASCISAHQSAFQLVQELHACRWRKDSCSDTGSGKLTTCPAVGQKARTVDSSAYFHRYSRVQLVFSYICGEYTCIYVYE